MIRQLIAFSLAVPFLCNAAVSDLSALLKEISAEIFPDLEALSRDVYNHPEISTEEFRTHDVVVDFFTTTHPGLFKVTPHAFGQPTAWRLDFENRPSGFEGDLLQFGYMAEYDALIGEGHACGHNHILLNGLASASMVRQAIVDLDLPVHLVVQGTPDEENTAGKNRLQEAGAFDGVDVWFAAHPAPFNFVQPMQARINGLIRLNAATHSEAVHKAYQELLIIIDLGTAGLPGTQSTDNPVEDVGLFSENIVQTEIDLGMTNVSLATVQQTVASIKAADAGFSAVNYTVRTVPGGVAVNYTGPGGHASESTKGPLTLSIETFRSLTALSNDITFFLPGNNTDTELDITVSCRTRYTLDIATLQNFVASAVQELATSITWDLAYPALEVTPYIPDLFINLMATSDFNETWALSTIAPAASDASFVQIPVLDSESRDLISTSKVVFFPNFNICAPDAAECPFPHEPAFRTTAGTDYAYSQTEKVARALAYIAVELLTDPDMMAQATAIIQ